MDSARRVASLQRAPGPDQLMAEWVAGDERSFSTLVHRFGPELHGFLRSHLGDDQLAEDAWSESWVRVVRNRERYQPTGQFRAWLYSIARRCAMDVQRGRRRWVNLAVKVFEWGSANATRAPSGELTVLRDERDAQLDRALLELPEEHRVIVLLSYQQEMTSTEVAATLGLTAQQVRSRLSYARRLLNDLLDKESL